MAVIFKVNLNPRYLYEQIENAVALAGIHVYLDMRREQLSRLSDRLRRADKDRTE